MDSELTSGVTSMTSGGTQREKDEPTSDEGFEDPEKAPQDHQLGQPAVEQRTATEEIQLSLQDELQQRAAAALTEARDRGEPGPYVKAADYDVEEDL
eukprot:3005891-Amphidinium_carterae.3